MCRAIERGAEEHLGPSWCHCGITKLEAADPQKTKLLAYRAADLRLRQIVGR